MLHRQLSDHDGTGHPCQLDFDRQVVRPYLRCELLDRVLIANELDREAAIPSLKNEPDGDLCRWMNDHPELTRVTDLERNWKRW